MWAGAGKNECCGWEKVTCFCRGGTEKSIPCRPLNSNLNQRKQVNYTNFLNEAIWRGQNKVSPPETVNPSQNRTAVMKLTRVKAHSKGVVLTLEPYWFWTKFSAQSFQVFAVSACLMQKQSKTWVPIILWEKIKLSQWWGEPGLLFDQFTDLEQTWIVERAINSVFVCWLPSWHIMWFCKCNLL